MNHMRPLLFGLLNSILVSAGAIFQKLNGDRGGSVVISRYVVAAACCMVPTFFIGNVALSNGGRLSVFAPATALTYVFSTLAGRVLFSESLGTLKLIGCGLIVLGVALVVKD